MSGKRRVAPVLELLIDALEGQGSDDGRAAARTLRALGELAAVEVPGRGVFAAAERDEVFSAIERIANAHLGFARRRRAFTAATGRVADFELRDSIQVAATDVRCVSDRAYFLAGIAFGVTLTRLSSPW
jgi:hypothetical protein